jgi:hypothetical protein
MHVSLLTGLALSRNPAFSIISRQRTLGDHCLQSIEQPCPASSAFFICPGAAVLLLLRTNIGPFAAALKNHLCFHCGFWLCSAKLPVLTTRGVYYPKCAIHRPAPATRNVPTTTPEAQKSLLRAMYAASSLRFSRRNVLIDAGGFLLGRAVSYLSVTGRNLMRCAALGGKSSQSLFTRCASDRIDFFGNTSCYLATWTWLPVGARIIGPADRFRGS